MIDPFQVRIIESVDELRGTAAAWDDLWQRSPACNPQSRAEPLALWCEHFTPEQRQYVVTVWRDGRMAAALPLVEGRLNKVFRVGALARNSWSENGELLLDLDAQADAALDRLVAAIDFSRFRMLWLDRIAHEAEPWRRFRQACLRADRRVGQDELHRVGIIDLRDGWEKYLALRKKSFLTRHRTRARKVEREGGAELRVHIPRDAADVESSLREAFAIEDRNWKRDAGTSVLQNPEILRFYLRESMALSASQAVELFFYLHRGTAIAFGFSAVGKGTHHMRKIGYDAEYRTLGPGQQLIFRVLQHLAETQPAAVMDCAGPLAAWHEPWTTGSYPVGRMVVAPSRGLGRRLFDAYMTWYPRWRSARQTWRRCFKPSGGDRNTAPVPGEGE